MPSSNSQTKLFLGSLLPKSANKKSFSATDASSQEEQKLNGLRTVCIGLSPICLTSPTTLAKSLIFCSPAESFLSLPAIISAPDYTSPPMATDGTLSTTSQAPYAFP